MKRGALLLAGWWALPAMAGCAPAPSGPPRRPAGPEGAPIAATASAAEIYAAQCAGCHGERGQGARGPSLAAARTKPEAVLVSAIRDGRRKMPAFGGRLSEAQIMALAGYVRRLPAK